MLLNKIFIFSFFLKYIGATNIFLCKKINFNVTRDNFSGGKRFEIRSFDKNKPKSFNKSGIKGI